MRAFIHKTQLDVMVLCETITIRMDTTQDSWPEMGMEQMPAIQAEVTTALRAVVATLI